MEKEPWWVVRFHDRPKPFVTRAESYVAARMHAEERFRKAGFAELRADTILVIEGPFRRKPDPMRNF